MQQAIDRLQLVLPARHGKVLPFFYQDIAHLFHQLFSSAGLVTGDTLQPFASHCLQSGQNPGQGPTKPGLTIGNDRKAKPSIAFPVSIGTDNDRAALGLQSLDTVLHEGTALQ